MNKIFCTFLGSGIMGLAVPAMAADPMPGEHMKMELKTMDTNSDGLVSKTEYMAYHEKMWMGMKKDAKGMVDGKMLEPMPNTPDKDVKAR